MRGNGLREDAEFLEIPSDCRRGWGVSDGGYFSYRRAHNRRCASIAGRLVHFTTTSTYKPGGPRGGLILIGKDYEQRVKLRGREVPLWECIEKTTFPGVQGTPYLNHIAAKAVFFKEAMSQEYRQRHSRIVENAKRLADGLVKSGWDVVTGGTDNHMVLINVANSRPGLTGIVAQKSLEDCSIVVNMNKLPFDTRKASVTSGMRLGTPIVTKAGMGPGEMDTISDMVDCVLRNVQVPQRHRVPAR